MNTERGEEFLRSTAERELGQFLNMEVSVGEIRTNIISVIKAENISLSKKRNNEIIPFVECETIEVTYNILSIIHYELEIENIHLNKLKFAVLIDSSGVYNFPEIQSGDESSDKEKTGDKDENGFGIRVNRINVDNGSFLYSDSGLPMEFKSDGIEILASYSIDGAFKFKLESPETVAKITDITAPVEDLSFNGSWESNTLNLREFSLQTLDLHGSGSLKLQFGEPSPLMDAAFIIEGNPGLLASTFADSSGYGLLPIDGILTADNKINGPFNKLEINSEITSERIVLNDKIFSNLVSSLKFSDNNLSIKSLRFESLGGKLIAEGNISVDSLLYHQMELTANGFNISEIRNMLNLDNINLTGNINASVSSEGPLKNPESLKVDANIIISELVNNKVKSSDIISNVNFDRGNIDAELSHAESYVKLDGELKKNNLTATMDATIPEITEIAELAGIKDLYGSAGLALKIKGKINSPDIAADFSSHNIRYMDFPVDTLSGHITMTEKGINLEGIYASGNLKSNDKRPFGLPDIEGGIIYTANVSGTPDNLKGNLEATMQNPGYGPVAFESAKISLSTEGEKVVLESQIYPGDSPTLGINGSYYLESKSGDFAVSIEDGGGITGNFEIPDFNDISVTASGQDIVLGKLLKLINENQSADGNINFLLNFDQNKGIPYASINFNGNSLKYQEAEIDSVKGNLELKDNVISLNPFNAFLDSNMASAQGMIRLSKEGGIDKTSYSSGEISFNEIDMSVISPFLSNIQLFGRFSLNGEWQGMLEKPSFSGSMDIADASVKRPDRPFIAEKVYASLSFSDTVLVLEDARGVVSGNPVTLTGRVSAPGWKIFNGEFNAQIANNGGLNLKGFYGEGSVEALINIYNFNVSAVDGIVPKVTKLKGNVISEINISGEVKNPEITGILQLSGLEFQPDFFKTPFTDGNASVRFNKDTVFVDSLSVKKDKAYGIASGSVTIGDGQISDIDISAIVNDFAINRREYLVNVDSLNVRYSKTDRGYLLNGAVDIGETKYRDNIRPKDIISMVKKQEKPKEDIPEMILETRLDVRITGGDNIWIDNNLAKIRLIPELQLIGSPSRPNVTGRLIAEEGYLLYFDRKFDVESAILDFTDPNKINPIIDLKSSAEVKGSGGVEYTINLNITGPLETAKVDITSNPTLDQADILSLLTIGATRSQLMASGEKGLEATGLLKERLEQLSSGTLSNYVTGNLGNALGLESLTVEGNLFNFGESSGPRLVASEKISDRLEITYTTNVGELNEQGISLDYSFTKRFAVSGYTNQIGNSGIDLKFKMKFK